MGGAETALRALALAAHKQGHSVKVISLKPLGSIGRDMQQQGLEVFSLDMVGKLNPLETAGVLGRLIQEIESFQPAVVHAFLYRAIQLCRLAKRKIPCRLITTPHYDLSHKNYLLRLLDRALKDEDTLSCAESRATASFLEKKQRYVSSKLRFVSNGVDLNHFIPDETARRQARALLHIADTDIVFLCVARLAAEKNHSVLLEAFKAVISRQTTARLLLVGDGPEKEKIVQIIRAEGLEKAVLLAGEVSNVKPYLLASDIFILVSSIESLPMSLLEACSCGLPAIVSKCGDMPSVVLHGETGFVCNAKDPIIISALMAELAENKPLRQRMGQAARRRIERYYTSPEQIYLKIYKEIQ